MPISSTTEICMLVWPGSPSTQVLGTNDSIAWILGWNDRSLYIVVAWYLRNCALEKAKLELKRICGLLQSHHTPVAEMPLGNLSILGCVRPHGSRVNAHAYAAAVEEEDIRTARKDSYLWLELLEGPVLGELWCCGARVQPCQLHVVRCDPAKVLSTRASLFSATALYGVSGIRQLQKGVTPLCAPGASSNLEGVLLPPVMRKEAEPRMQPRRQSLMLNLSFVNDSFARFDESLFLSEQETLERQCRASEKKSQATLSSGTSSPTHQALSSLVPGASPESDIPLSRSSRHPIASISDASATFSEEDVSVTMEPLYTALLSDSDLDHFECSEVAKGQRSRSQASKPSVPSGTAPPQNTLQQPQAGIPPRLDFPSTADRGEISVFLATMRAGRDVRRIIQNEPLHECTREGHMEPLPVILKYIVDFISTYVVGLLRHLRFSKTAEILLYRTSEFAHFLCVLSFANESCGLHPVLPHRVSRSFGHRYVCMCSYLSRCAVDLLLGVLVYLCVSTWGPSLYVAAQYTARYWLYEVHAAYMDWFDGYPAGLKVNEDLNMALCFLAKCVLEVWDALLSWSPATLPSLVSFRARPVNMKGLVGVPPPGSTRAAASSSPWSYPDSEDQLQAIYEWVGMAFQLRMFCLFGCSTAAAFVSDLTGLVSLHLRFLYHAMALPYRCACVLLSNLFRQFYGVKYNPLRKRYDSYHFQADQMLAATFLFVIVVFLFPTLTVYYTYFSFVLASIWGMERFLESIAYLSLHIPVYPIVYWLCRRHHLSGGVALSTPVITSVSRFLGMGTRAGRRGGASRGGGGTVGEEIASHTVEVTVESLPLSLSMMLTDFFVVMDVIMASLQPWRIVSHAFRGKMETTPKMADLLGPHLLTDSVSPRCTLCTATTNKTTSKKNT